MQGSSMPNRHPFSDDRAVVIRKMHNHVVLQVTAVSDYDGMNIPA